MAIGKISTKHQVTIPKSVFTELKLMVGDHVEIIAEDGRVVVTPQRMVARAPATRLSEGEQETLLHAKQKIRAIQEDMLNSTGLSRQEADVAAKAGLIDPDQVYWWMEEWQEGERAAEKDDREGRYEEFGSVREFSSRSAGSARTTS